MTPIIGSRHNEKPVVVAIGSKWESTTVCFVSKSDREEAVLINKGVYLGVLGTFNFKGVEMVDCIHWNKTKITLPLEQLLVCFREVGK